MDDAQLWQAFTTATLPAAAWTHAAHLRVAHMHLARHTLDDAHILMRVGIIKLNAAHGLVETPVRGYHETITRVWLILVQHAARSVPGSDSPAFLAAQEHTLRADAPLRHYTKGRLFSSLARAMFIEPDLEPLPA